MSSTISDGHARPSTASTHLSCWRSTPRVPGAGATGRRSRPSSSASQVSTQPALSMADQRPRAPGMPIGIGDDAERVRERPGRERARASSNDERDQRHGHRGPPARRRQPAVGNSRSSDSTSSGAIGWLAGFHSQAADSAPGPPWRAY